MAVSIDRAETPVITVHPVSKTVNVNGEVMLSVTAVVNRGGELSYQWYSNTTDSNSGGTLLSSATASTLMLLL